MDKIKIKAIEKKFAPKKVVKKIAQKTAKKTVLASAVKEKIAKTVKTDKVSATSKKVSWQFERKFLAAIGGFVIGVIIFVGIGYEFEHNKKESMNKKDISTEASLEKKQIDLINTAVARNFGLAYDEDPVFATVTDIEKMRAQQFFVKIENDDKVLIYTQNKKIILFRPSTNKILNISQELGMNAGATNQNTTVANPDDLANSEKANDSGEKTTSAKIVVANGARIGGLAQRIGEMLMNTFGVTISEKTNTIEKYKNTIVVDLSGSNSMLAQKIAGAVGGEVASLPEGEKAPSADILVIGGSNFGIN
jgi:hypothetical protein